MGDERLDFRAKFVGKPARIDELIRAVHRVTGGSTIPIFSFPLNPFFDPCTEADGHSGRTEGAVREQPVSEGPSQAVSETSGGGEREINNLRSLSSFPLPL